MWRCNAQNKKVLYCRFQKDMAMEERNFGRKKRGKRVTLQTVADITRAVVILGVAVVLLLGTWLKIAFVMQIDSLLRYGFGGISLLYGGFRLYRGIKGEAFRDEI